MKTPAVAGLSFVVLFGLTVSTFAQPVPLAPSSEVDSDLQARKFTLLPKIFQRNPTLEMTAFTEVTAHGKTLAPATPEAPQYYALTEKGRQDRGEVMAGDAGPSREELLAPLQRALARAGYRPADETHPATLALIWYWGSHNAPDGDMIRMFPDLAFKYAVDAAMLVGGRHYAQKIFREFDVAGWDYSVSAKKDFLRTQVAEDLYYVVVSAYALGEIAQNQHRVLWRTSMTVNTRGVSMRESLPPLIMTAGDYFGRATTESVALRRAVRRGTVKLGPMEILESSDWVRLASATK